MRECTSDLCKLFITLNPAADIGQQEHVGATIAATSLLCGP